MLAESVGNDVLNGECVARARALASITLKDSYLVDPASSHMLVSKIKPCMCKFTLINSKTADGSLQQY